MVTAKKAARKSPKKPGVTAVAVPTYVVRTGKAGFTCPPGSTITVLPSGALVVHHPTYPNAYTHAFAPGQWLTVNV